MGQLRFKSAWSLTVPHCYLSHNWESKCSVISKEWKNLLGNANKLNWSKKFILPIFFVFQGMPSNLNWSLYKRFLHKSKNRCQNHGCSWSYLDSSRTIALRDYLIYRTIRDIHRWRGWSCCPNSISRQAKWWCSDKRVSVALHTS